MNQSQQKTLLYVAAAGAVLYFLSKRQILLQPNPQRAKLIEWANTATTTAERDEYQRRVNLITAADLPAMFSLITEYFPTQRPVPQTLQTVWDRYFSMNR